MQERCYIMTESMTKLERARQWVSQAIAAGMDPKLLHYPPDDPNQAGRWFYQSEPENDALDPGPRPEDIKAEIREVLYQLGRAYDCRNGHFHQREAV
jgi:hypothetical protein